LFLSVGIKTARTTAHNQVDPKSRKTGYGRIEASGSDASNLTVAPLLFRKERFHAEYVGFPAPVGGITSHHSFIKLRPFTLI